MQPAAFGPTGRTGVPLVEQTLECGHPVAAHTCSFRKLAIEHERVDMVVGDAYTDEGVRETVAGDNIVTAMEDVGVVRFVTLVGAGVRTEGELVSVGGRVVGALLKFLARSVLEDAKTHVASVRETDRQWTVLRAHRLTAGSGSGGYRAGDIDFVSAPRADGATRTLDIVAEGLYFRELSMVGSS
ncbi:NAD(P)H-binding protein [Haloarchaeobius litoreus]|uniref:NAD(P)H-binding protein n=1 Tax=Haloarchaeobius litoreus TaxID=755306 RepID=A0ABD6DMG3_9EURY|nr:NAD(P)H-binding protein [Haloarchaeobius litoreus]